MGGQDVRHKLKSTEQVQCNADVWKVFLDSRWHVYFERLQGFNEAIIVEFVLNLEGNHSRVCGMDIYVTEEAISISSGFK